MTAYTQRRHLPYSAPQLFDLVADVERYPDFLLWVAEAEMHHGDERHMLVQMTIKTGPLRRRFSTTASLDRPHRIDVTSHDPIFDRFEQRWRFEPAAAGGTDVEYHVIVEFRSRLLQMLLGAMFANLAEATMSAFRQRARCLLDGR